MTRHAAFPFALLGAALLAGCAVGPDYSRPEVPISATYKHEAGWRSLATAEAPPVGAWWVLYDDPELDRLMRETADANLSVAQAEARYRQALAQLRVSRAGTLPQVQGNASAQRSGRENNAGGSSLSSSDSTSYQIGVTASWVPDLWGKLRRQLEADRASIASSAAELDAMRLSMQSTVAQAYLRIRAIDLYLGLLDLTREAYTRSLELTRNQYRAGLAARADVIQSEVQLQSLMTQETGLRQQRMLEENAIAVLLGRPPAGFSVARTDALPPLPAIPAQMPSALLVRRPDVIAAERQVAVANANIGVAEGAWFPDLTLSAQGALQEGRFIDLFNAPQLIWSVGPSLAATLFDSGRRSALVEQSRAQYDEQVAAYRQTFLTGVQEVEDALATLQMLEAKAGQQARLVELAEENERVVTNRYRAGLVSFLEVSVAQDQTYTSRRTALEIRAEQLAASIRLVVALGGGWR